MIFSDIFLVYLAFYSAVLLRYEFVFPNEIKQFLGPQSYFLFIANKILWFKIFGLYRGMWRYTSVWDMINVFKSNILASCVLVLAISIIYGFEGISTDNPVTFAPNNTNQDVSHDPLNPVCPVTKTFLFLNCL